MTTPAQPLTATASGAGPVEQYFDANLKPQMLAFLQAADGGAAAAAVQAHNSMTAAIEYRIQAYGARYAGGSQETRDAVAAIVSELQGLLDDGRAR